MNPQATYTSNPALKLMTPAALRSLDAAVTRVSNLVDDLPARRFDWMLATEIIRIAKPRFALAGLIEHWDVTAQVIYLDGAPVLEAVQSLSTVDCMPALCMPYGIVPCVDRCGSDAEWQGAWPEEALRILRRA